jgi:hypothetical protein
MDHRLHGAALWPSAAWEELAVRKHSVRYLGAASLLGVALLIVSTAGAFAAPGSAVKPADFRSHHLVKAGSFSDIAEAVDSNGKVHIAAGDGNDIWYLTNRTGTWTAAKAFVHSPPGPKGFLWGSPTIALDSNDRVHIAATRFPFGGEGGIGIFYATDLGHAPGAFGAPTQIAPGDDGEPQLKVYNGNLYLVAVKDWCCVGDGTVVMRTNKSGSWTQAPIGPGQEPSFQMTSDGFARVVYQRGDTAPGLYYAVAGTHKGNFATTHVAGTNAKDGSPLLALSFNTAQIAWQHSTKGPGSWRFTYSSQGDWHSFYTVPGSTSNMEGAIAATNSFFAHVALAGVDVTDHQRCGSVLPGTWCNDSVASDVQATAVASAGGPSNSIDIAWIQGGDIWYASQHFVNP